MKRFPQASILSGSLKTVLAVSSALVLGSTGIAVAEPTNIAASGSAAPLADGTYLYGDTDQANQIGHGYVVFKKQGQTVTGAFFYPQSEFSCFTGTAKNQRLEVLSLGSPYENALEVEVPLTKMHHIKSVGDTEQNSLSMCQQEVAAYQKQQQIAAPVTQWTTP
ncbi:hypothetical protein [Acaryochloris marina]|uniref:DM13 domain-containing protein n=1 Tax=Acaryochloris marina (strain MBIC 11017) TaxID=329726 RepID=B0CA89_ACAM1|nr:hypothetical protein [Acaryochloris marina]ABW27824.1 hypothetical protein AM1_2824 [Acaryochloris marina MBIC11017]BDM82551.1 hypothetical protein AM10699_54120 [Acaryochloris marina MBIC10699]